MTVWDVRSRRESLTLNNVGRKAVSAVAWDPERVSFVPLTTEGIALFLTQHAAHETDHVHSPRS